MTHLSQRYTAIRRYARRRRTAFALISLILLGVLFGLGATAATAQERIDALEQSAEDQAPVRVAIKLIDPFVMQEGDQFVGFSIDLWEELAHRHALPYEYILKDSVNDLIVAVETGEADLGLAAVSITADREAVIDFSHSYFASGLQIMTAVERTGLFRNLLLAFTSAEFLRVMAGFIFLIVIAAHIVWLIERHNNPGFPRGYVEGILEALWWSVVTATTVGYGDKVPIRRTGRLMAIVWMFGGVFLVAYVTAVFSSSITVNELRTNITGPEDLRGRRVAAVEGTTSDDFLSRNGIFHLRVDQIEEAYRLLENGDVEAIVYDAPTLVYYASNEGNGQVEVVGRRFQREDYGIVMPQHTPYREAINLALLEMQQDGVEEELLLRWFGSTFD